MKIDLEQAWNLNMNLLQTNIRLWHTIREYCRKNRIDIPETEDSRKMDYYLYQLYEMIQEINASPTPMKHFDETTDKDNRTVFELSVPCLS